MGEEDGVRSLRGVRGCKWSRRTACDSDAVDGGEQRLRTQNTRGHRAKAVDFPSLYLIFPWILYRFVSHAPTRLLAMFFDQNYYNQRNTNVFIWRLKGMIDVLRQKPHFSVTFKSSQKLAIKILHHFRDMWRL